MDNRIETRPLQSAAVLLLLSVAGAAPAEVSVATNNTFAPLAGAGVVAGEATDNSSYGDLALSALTTGDRNSAFGSSALKLVTTASDNTAFGAFALAASTVTGNSAFGSAALNLNTTGRFNNAFGAGALNKNLTGESNNAFGSEVLGISTGSYNSGFGDQALWSNTSGEDNVAFGVRALFSNTSGTYNSAVGDAALRLNTSGSSNVAIGHQALEASTRASFNVAVGVVSLFHSTLGTRNTAVGHASLSANRTGGSNVGIGYLAGSAITTGSNNIAIGATAGSSITTGSNNIDIGNLGARGDTAVIRLGKPGAQTRTFIAGIRGATVSGAAVVASASGQLGVQSSSRRYKKDIDDMGQASDALLKLRPVTFRYKQADERGEHPLQYGLIAEEVAEVMPALVVRDEAGNPETVAYQTLSSLLLNEYQKQHRDMQALAATAQAEARSAAARVTGLEQKLEARDRELTALHDELAKLGRLTRQLQAALPAAPPLADNAP